MHRRRIAPLLVAALLALLAPSQIVAHASGGSGRSVFANPQASIHGQAQSHLLAQWGQWVFGSPAETNDALNGVCAPSPHDRKVWFLPVSTVSGDTVVHCRVPHGALLLVSPGGYECSEAEGNGSTRGELVACADEGFVGMTSASVTVRGHEYGDIDRYIQVSPVYQLPGPNLFGPDPGPSLTKGYFLFVKPLKPGHHTIGSSISFSDGFEGGFTYEIEVVRGGGH